MYQKDEDEVLETVCRLCRESDRPLIVTAKNNERLCEELIAVRQRGKRVVTLVSDLDPSARDVFIGIDNRMAGQTAALLIGRLIVGRPCKVGVIVGDYAFRCHEDREIGFRAYHVQKRLSLAGNPLARSASLQEWTETSIAPRA